MPRKQKKYHIIYKTVNILNSKYYIGMHSTDDLNDGYLGSGKRLRYSINKYGKENHIVEILEFLPNRKELKRREEEIVNEDLLKQEDCINLCTGGEGLSSFDFSKNMKSLWKNHDYRVRAISNTRKHMKIRHEKGLVKYDTFLNKSHSEETKAKIGKANSKHQKGKGNSQYGTCWICSEKEIKKIKKEDLSKYESLGWKKGRKLNNTV